MSDLAAGPADPVSVPAKPNRVGQVPAGRTHTGQVPTEQTHAGQVPVEPNGAGQVPAGRTRAGPPPVRRALLLLVVGLAGFVTTLDNTVVTVALPTIQTELGASLATLEWVVTGYVLTFAGLMLAGAAWPTCTAAARCSSPGSWSSRWRPSPRGWPVRRAPWSRRVWSRDAGPR
nr:hypothetical protein GCM10020093_065290 [Planobispora longispora]